MKKKDIVRVSDEERSELAGFESSADRVGVKKS